MKKDLFLKDVLPDLQKIVEVFPTASLRVYEEWIVVETGAPNGANVLGLSIHYNTYDGRIECDEELAKICGLGI